MLPTFFVSPVYIDVTYIETFLVFPQENWNYELVNGYFLSVKILGMLRFSAIAYTFHLVIPVTNALGSNVRFGTAFQ